MEVPEEVLKRVAEFVYEKKQLRLGIFIERLSVKLMGLYSLSHLTGFIKSFPWASNVPTVSW